MKQEIISQYKAALTMLLDCINHCPEDLWDNDNFENPYWRIVYHTLFYTVFYLSKSPAEFVPWKNHIKDYNELGTFSSANNSINITTIYSKEEMKEYLQSIILKIENIINSISEKERSEFYWLDMSKIELHLYNIRHIQHHTGQLTCQLQSKSIKGIAWRAMV